MGNPRVVTPELLARIERIARMRIAARAIPSDQCLADEAGVKRTLISRWMRAICNAIIAGGQPQKQELERVSGGGKMPPER